MVICWSTAAKRAKSITNAKWLSRVVLVSNTPNLTIVVHPQFGLAIRGGLGFC